MTSSLSIDTQDLQVRIAQSQRLVKRRALLAAGVAVLPVPGLDWATDVGVLWRVIPQINRIFGLSADQIEHLAPHRQVLVYQAISAVGGALVGKVITQKMLWHALRTVGVRLSAQQMAKFVPLAGQATSAALTFFALKFVCDRHIGQCVAVSQKLLSQASSH